MKIEVNVAIDLSENTKEFLKTLLNPLVLSSGNPASIKNKPTGKKPQPEEEIKTEEAKKIEAPSNDKKVEAVEDKKMETGTIPVSVKTYTLQELGNAAKIVMDSGKREDLVELLASFGVKALTQLDVSKYNEFANKLRELGGDI